MPGYNHYAWCACGWCQGGGGDGGYNLSIHRTQSQVQRIEFIEACNESKTCLTTCWYCGDTVYYHTNGYGDCVLFDDLGWPWPVHKCWKEYWESEKERRKLLSYLGVSRYQSSPQILYSKSISDYNKKRLLILGVVKSLERQSKPLTEKNVLQAMGLTPEELFSHYGGLYELYRQSGIIYLRLVKELRDN